ncbi:MAG: DUF2341 domain-containing protein, partial [Anaerolineales bacterium]|nr:DUF2341 domain-containing protein [Anaerolineales bacterium]
VLIKLDSSRIDYANTKDLGEDIRFVDADGTTVLSHEIEKWDEAGTSWVWVKVPQIDGSSNTDYIWMYYGNPSATDQQNAAGVWSNGYAGVWHLNETATDEQTSATHTDSTANSNNGTQHENASVGGQIAGAQDFDLDDYINVPDHASIDFGASQDFTVSAWVKSTQAGAANKWPMIVQKGSDGSSPRYEYSLILNNAISNPEWFFDTYSNGSKVAVFGNLSVTDGTWHYIVGTRSGANHSTNEDGA